MKEVTVVIPNYNGEKYLVPCLKALYERSTVDFDVLVVDNGSKDPSIEQAKERYPQTKVVRFDKNYGFCKAVNEGIKRAKTKYVLLLNNDTEIRKGFVEHLLRKIQTDEKIFSVEAKMIQYQDQSLIDSAGTYYCALGWAYARGRDKSVGRYIRPADTFAACGGAAIYRKDVFEQIGYFDEKHFAYLEDVDVGYRARIYGYRNCYEPKAEVIHVGSAASGSRYNEFKTRYSGRNNIYLIYKNMPMWQIVLNSPLLLAGFMTKILFFFRKGMGKTYVKGLAEGMMICRKRNRVPFLKENTKHYLKIQVELWMNCIRRFM